MVKVLKNKLKSIFGNWRQQEAVLDDIQVIIAVTVGVVAFLTFLSVGCSGMKPTPLQVSRPESDRRDGAGSTNNVERPPAPNLYREHEWHGRY